MKVSADCYTIRTKPEWGNFYLREGVDQQGHRWAELTCNTAFGCVGHFWGSIGTRSASEFLAGVDKGYLLGKLWGGQTRKFDPDAAVAQAKRHLLEERHAREISKADARDVYESIGDSVDHEADWYNVVESCSWLYTRAVDGVTFGMVPNPQAEGFWRDLWPAFIAELTASAADAQRAEG